MKQSIKENIDHPEQLEKLYQADKKNFKNKFFELYDEISTYKSASFWKARLEFDAKSESNSIVKKTDIYYLIITCLITGFLVKLPQLFDLNLTDYFYYEKNVGLIMLMGLSAYCLQTEIAIRLIWPICTCPYSYGVSTA